MAKKVTPWVVVRTAGELLHSLGQTFLRNPRSIPHIPSWFLSFRPSSNSVDDERPWMPFTVANWLGRTLDEKSRVFEYGSGGSTLFLAKQAGEVVSVEHNREWYDHMRTVLSERGVENCSYLFQGGEPVETSRECEVCDVSHESMREEYDGVTFDSYVSTIDDYEDASFDLVVVDGRARPACIAHALPKLKPGGYILLDDTHRGHYHERIPLDVADAKIFRGIRPYSSYVCETMVWQPNGNGSH